MRNLDIISLVSFSIYDKAFQISVGRTKSAIFLSDFGLYRDDSDGNRTLKRCNYEYCHAKKEVHSVGLWTPDLETPISGHAD